MVQSIPAAAIVSVTPTVLSAGGTALNLNGLFVTNNQRVPIGTVLSLPTLAAANAYFGPNSAEAAQAAVYFLGFNNSARKPGAVLFAQYPTGPVPAYLRGGPFAGVTLAAVQAITGTLAVTVDGVARTVAAVNLAAATSLSNAATLLGAALALPVVYDALSGGFVITSATSGVASTVAYASGTAAAALGLTQSTGALLSQGAVPMSPAAAMNSFAAQTTNWASFTVMFDLDQAGKLAFAAWTNAQGNRYLYVCVDSDIAATQNNSSISTGYLIKYQFAYSGVAMVYRDLAVGSFLMGFVAALDFNENNGRATAAFRGQTGLPATVVDQVTYQNLIANGYNFYGAYATANDRFLFLYNGQVTGPFLWLDSYVNEIWMGNAFQLAILQLLINAKSVPYNADGYGLVQAACADVIQQALRFGAIRAGVTLSQAQIDLVNMSAGVKIDRVLATRGWYLQVSDATPQVRAARASPPCTFWYVDGQSIQSINLTTVQVQ